MGVAGSTGASAKQTISTPTVATAAVAKNPSVQEVRKKLGPDFQFLLNAPPPSGGKVKPGDAQILRSLCGTCTPEATSPWSTLITRKDGTTVTLADLYKMRQDGTRWERIAQRELGVKLGSPVRTTAGGRQVSTPSGSSFSSTSSARSGKSFESGIFTGANRSMDGSAVLYGRGGERSGIVTGSGELVMDHSQGGAK
jgi:hypothetical protein